MIKYLAGTLAAVVAILAAIFVAVAAVNDRHEGPAPLIEIRVTDDALTPESIEVDKGRLIEYRLVNDASQQRSITTNTPNVEMLPAESNPLDFGNHNSTSAVRYVNITASAGDVASALVRFTEGGEYELRVETAGRPETLRIARVIVR